jgi:hypothetical protein
LVYSTTQGHLRFWDPQTGEEVLPATPCDSDGPQFSPDGKWFCCTVGGRTVVSRLPADDRPYAQVEGAVEALSQRSLQTIEARRWSVLRRQFTEVFATQDQSRPGVSDSPATSITTYTVDDVLRDTGMHFPDLHGLLDAAQASARADQWGAAGQSIDEAVREGATGPGVSFLQGVVALRERRYADSEKALTIALKGAERRGIALNLFQASVGAKDFGTAAAVSERTLSEDGIPATLRNAMNAMLARAADGGESAAKESFRDIMRRGQRGEFPNAFDYVLPTIAIAGEALDPEPDSAAYFVDALTKDTDADPNIGPALTLALARIGKDDAAASRLAKVGSFEGEPEYLLANALVCQRKGTASYRDRLRSCIDGCETIIRGNDAQSLDLATKILRAILVEREARQKLRQSSSLF